jgi:hypothetical protein
MAPTSRITYADIQSYLEAVANNPQSRRSVDSSGHGRFWEVPYQEFVTGSVPNEQCNGASIKIVDSDPNNCAFYQALRDANGWCNLSQMPMTGPFITDPGYSVVLSSGTVISGADIDANIVWWLTNGMPET